MAPTRTLHLIDDLDGTGGPETLTFALNGVAYDNDFRGAHVRNAREEFATERSGGTAPTGRLRAAQDGRVGGSIRAGLIDLRFSDTSGDCEQFL